MVTENLNIQRQIRKLPYILDAVGADSADYVILSDTSDGGRLKIALVSSFPGGGGGATNLSYDAATRTVASDIGTDAVLTLADGTNPGLLTSAQFVKLGFLGITQAVDLDVLESDTALNNTKITNATHTGDVTGATVLTLDKIALTGKGSVTADALDYVLISDTSDSGNLKKALVSDFLVGTGTTNLSYDAATRTISSDTGTDAILTLVNSTNAGLMLSADFDKLALITGINTGDQTTIVGITGTKAQFDTAVTDGNFLFVGDAPTAHTHVEADITDFGTYSTDIHSNIVALNAVSGTNTGDQDLSGYLTVANIEGGNSASVYGGTAPIDGGLSNTF